MHRTALIRKAKKGLARVKPQKWSAPVGGWNTAVPFDQMPPTMSPLLQNFFPEAGFVRARNGSIQWATGLGAQVNSIMPYMGSTNKLFGAAGTNIYDVSSPGAVGAAAVSGLTDDHWSAAQISTGGGHYLQIANGFDSVQQFDGTSWTVPAWTGVATNLLSVVQLYRSRFYFIQKNSTIVWFGGTDAITGTLTSLDIGPNMEFGGVLVAMGTWTTVVTAGPLEFICFITSNGEVVIFQGSNPTDSTNWSLLGSCKMSNPLGGDRCCFKLGGDLAVMTMDGIIPVSKAFFMDPSASDQNSLTKNIAPTWLSTVEVVSPALAGWSLVTYPHRRMCIINVPDPTGVYQFVMNTETKAWTKFVALNAACWSVWIDSAYFGSPDGNVYQAETGGSDNGSPIDCLGICAWDFGDGITQRQVATMSMMVNIGTTASIYGGVSVDFNPITPLQAATSASSVTPSEWDVSDWDEANWFPGQEPLKLISASSGAVGVVLGVTFRALVSGSASDTSNTYIYGGSVLIERGSFI